MHSEIFLDIIKLNKRYAFISFIGLNLSQGMRLAFDVYIEEACSEKGTSLAGKIFNKKLDKSVTRKKKKKT